MVKIKVGLDSQVLEDVIAISEDKFDGKEEYANNLKQLIKLMQSNLIEGCISKSSFNSISEKYIQNQEDSEHLLGILSINNIQVYSAKSCFEDIRAETRKDILIILDENIDVFLVKNMVEHLETSMLRHADLYSESKFLALKPKDFLKLLRIQALETNITSEWLYDFRNIKSLDELMKLHQFEEEVLPEDTPLVADKLEEWWRSYQAGIKALFLGERLMGVISIWPISEESAHDLKEAIADKTFQEKELSVLPYKEELKCRHYYIGGFYLHESLRSQGLGEGFASKLLLQALVLWLAGGQGCYQPQLPTEEGIEILSIPVSPFAERMLRRVDFNRSSGETSDGFPLYTLLAKRIDDLYPSIS